MRTTEELEGKWARWTMRKSGYDGRRASGYGYHYSAWHRIGVDNGDGTLVTYCGMTVAPHVWPYNHVAKPRQGASHTGIARHPDEIEDGKVCRRCKRKVERYG